MRAFRNLFVASLREFVRDRTSLSFTIILPLLLVAFFGFAYSGSTSRLIVGIASDNVPAITPAQVSRLRNDPSVQLEYGNRSTELARLHDGTIGVVLTAGKAGGQPVIYYDRGDAGIALAARALAIDLGSGSGRRESVARLATVSGLTNSRLDYVIPGILATAIMWLGIFAAIPLVQQREQQVLRRFAVTPVSRRTLVLAQVLGRLVISLIQAALVLTAARFLFGVPIGAQVGSTIGAIGIVMVLVLLGALAFVSIGYAVAALSSTQSGAHAWAQLLTMPMLLLAGVFFPIALMPGALRPIVALLPLTYLADALRQTALDGQHFVPIGVDLGAMAAWIVVSIAIAVRYFRWS
ncbi:MAG TPA: ABC transporter permease [Chloroflexota bacterium]|jgi:ABC-2 type transport system permease protein|nr:ABC transporter permease [Chloroflexota bacterium]